MDPFEELALEDFDRVRMDERAIGATRSIKRFGTVGK